MSLPSTRRAAAFTLIELLVVIAIIAVLIALLVPAVQKVREAAARTQCLNNLKQLALGCHAYEGVHQRMPTLYSAGTNDGWLVQIMPFIEQDNLCRLYTPGNWTAAANRNVINLPVPLFTCPLAGLPQTVTIAGASFGEFALTD